MQRANKIYQILVEMYPEVRCELNYQDHFQLLIAVILSAQTTDAQVNKVTPALFENYPDAFSLSKASFSEVHHLIKTLGLSNTKARNIIASAKILVAKHNGIVPSSYEELLALPGVGRKTANVIRGEAFRIPSLPVDTHVLRVSKRLSLTQGETPEIVEKDLAKLYPKEEWYGLHLRLIHFGRYFCKARSPQCSSCLLTSYCQYYTKKHPS